MVVHRDDTGLHHLQVSRHLKGILAIVDKPGIRQFISSINTNPKDFYCVTKEGLNRKIGENPGVSCCALSCRCKKQGSSYLNGLHIYLPDECTPFILNAFIF